MKRAALYGILFLLPFLLKAQSPNLVPNPGFEDSITCMSPYGYHPVFWFAPTMGTPDYFLPSSSSSFGCFDDYPSRWGGGNYTNNWGYQLPRSGRAYTGFAVTQGTEYIAIGLTDSLESGKEYVINAYVSLANWSGSGMDLIQFAFSRDSLTHYDTVTGGGWPLDTVHPQATNPAGNIIMDTAGWVLVTDTFIAQGGEKYMTVGSFQISQTQYQINDSNIQWNFSYYYFDDFDLHCIDCDTHIVEPPQYSDISLNPNPSNGQLWLNGDFPASTRFKIYNSLGQIVYEAEIPEGNRSEMLTVVLASGAYCYVLDSELGMLKTGKLILTQ